MDSAFGAFLDPVADILMMAVAQFLLVQSHPTWLLAVTSAVIVGREITVSALREWMAFVGERGRVKVQWIGKFKTVMQIVAILILLWEHDKDATFLRGWYVGEVLLVVAAILTIWSGLAYMRAAWPVLRDGRMPGEGTGSRPRDKPMPRLHCATAACRTIRAARQRLRPPPVPTPEDYFVTGTSRMPWISPVGRKAFAAISPLSLMPVANSMCMFEPGMTRLLRSAIRLPGRHTNALEKPRSLGSSVQPPRPPTTKPREITAVAVELWQGATTPRSCLPFLPNHNTA